MVLMSADPLDQVLRLVAEGRLTAEEAAPILAALDERSTPRRERGEPPGGFGSNPPPGYGAGAGAGADAGAASRGATTLRIEVRDGGRSVVNLRLPIAVGRFALDRVPGLSGDQVTRVREALSSGLRGPVLEVDDEGDGVRIVLE
ncbi:MAG: hypothetical protein A2V85_17785 [Chloroflexi bacterium RBG_16_72_14]|nr:MAG: hypothetical protein A2V85_17785 [Chloroflexi bacterium RBG_16_72_14]